MNGEGDATYYFDDQESMYFNNATVNFMIYNDSNPINETIYKFVRTVADGNSKSIFQFYSDRPDEFDHHFTEDDHFYVYKKRETLKDILNILGEEAAGGVPDGREDNYLLYPKVFIIDEYQNYSDEDKAAFVEAVGEDGEYNKYIQDSNIIFILMIHIDKIPSNSDDEEYLNDEGYDQYNIMKGMAMDLQSATIRFYFLYGYKRVLDIGII